MSLPKGFLIGASTAAHQVEGNNIHSDYWAQEQMKYTSFNEPSGIACDHYHRYREDIAMITGAGLNAYRFSIEWARIEPQPGVYDETEIEHYRQVIACCRASGIEPIVTLHHFTSPKWLIDQGGWENSETIDRFAAYARLIAERLGDQLHYICTINEANMGVQMAAIMKRYAQLLLHQQSAEGQIQMGVNLENPMMERMQKQREENVTVFGTENPQTFTSGRTAEGDRLVMLAHQAARKVIKEVRPELQVGLTLSLHDIQAVDGGEDAAAKEWADEFTHYLPYLREDDFFGVQNYTRTLMGRDGSLPLPEGAKTTQMGYEIYPQALEHVIRKVYKDLPLPILVTENGIATADDAERISFIREAMTGVKHCIADGIPVRGYCHWSLMDNFEWQKGYSMTFGLISVNRETMERTLKPSLTFLGSYADRKETEQ